MKSSFQMTGSTASTRQINSVGYLDFANTSNLASSNIMQMYQSGTTMIYHEIANGGSYEFYVNDPSGNTIRPLLIDINGLTLKNRIIQTTAFTSAIKDTISIDKNPVGTILPYAGKMIDIQQSYPPPAGYLWCDGSSVSQTTYSSLFTVIGQNYRNNKTSITGSFYVPDLRSAFLKDVWESPFFPDNV